MLDEPTNHLDLEAIEALVEGARATTTARSSSSPTTAGSSPASRTGSSRSRRTASATSAGATTSTSTRCGDDHLDADAVLLKLRRARKEKAADKKEPEPKRQNRLRALEKKRDELARQIEAMESRVHDISERFLDPALFGKGAQAEARQLEEEQKKLKAKIDALMTEWGDVEAEIEAAGS